MGAYSARAYVYVRLLFSTKIFSLLADVGPDVIIASSEDENEDDDEISKNQNLRMQLRAWALNYNISHTAVKDLLQIVNDRFMTHDISILPNDPRTFLQTPQNVNIIPVGDGEYWHNGLKNCLQIIFRNLRESTSISLTLNIDGLPIAKSSRAEFWPILFNIAELPKVSPMVIGIFSGKAKASDLESFLSPFVDEMKEISSNGLRINSHKLCVRLRCFVCDSPARAFVKGIYAYIPIWCMLGDTDLIQYMYMYFYSMMFFICVSLTQV